LAAPALRWRFAALAVRFLAFSALRCLAWIFLRAESDIVGMDVSPFVVCWARLWGPVG
jgi:hypothetical protein